MIDVNIAFILMHHKGSIPYFRCILQIVMPLTISNTFSSILKSGVLYIIIQSVNHISFAFLIQIIKIHTITEPKFNLYWMKHPFFCKNL